MACRYTYQGKTYEAHEFDGVLRAMRPADAASFMPTVKSIPEAPFVGKTDAYVALALKRIIKLAVDEGYDKVAFVNGEQSAARYDLSKQVDQITYDKVNGSSPPAYRIKTVGVGRGTFEDAGIHAASKLDGVVGKELANKILADESGSGVLRGLDLKVGGEGMKAFYDKIVPSVAKDVLKKLGGGKLGEVQIRSAETTSRSHADAQRDGGRFGKWETPTVLAQPGFDITPTMREMAAGGLPMFSKKQQPAQPNGHLKVDVPEETKTEASRRVLQDQHIRMRKLREWALENGAQLSSASDVYSAEERMHGRIATRVEDFRTKTVQPLIERAQKLGYTMEQVAAVMHAQHAEERNKQIAKINLQMPDGGSGMTTADARAALAAVPANLKALAGQFQAITTRSRDILLRSGVISQETANAWDGAYKHYVPLKGGDEADAAKRAGIGKGLSVNGKSKRALGHGEREEAIVENILRDHEKAITLAEKNRVGQAMMLWLTEMADERIGTVDKPVKRAVLKPGYAYDVRLRNLSVQTFTLEADARRFIQQQINVKSPGAIQMKIVKQIADEHVQYMAGPMLDENEAQAYVNGHAVRMQLNDPRLAQAYKRLNADQMGRLMEISRQINTYLSRAYTGYNPAFIPRNLIRDFGSGVVKLTGNFGAGTTAGVIARYPRALGTLLRYSYSGTSTPSIDAYRANGGSTGAAWLGDLERIGSDIQHDYEKYQGVMAQLKAGKKVAAARVAAGKLIGGLVGWIEHLNAATENAMRLATFEQIYKETGSLEQAASAAKNSTINFNRKGEVGPTMGALYLFFNPNIQDTASVIETFTRGKHRGQAGALVGAMIGLTYALAALQFGGGDDDYEEWKKIPDNVRDKNLLLRTGKGSYITIPVPFGFGFFHTLGNTIFMAQHGENLNYLSVGMASNLFDHFSPVGNPLQGARGWDKADPLMMLGMLPGAPGTGELGRDAVRSITNRSSFGSPIVPDSKFDEDRPDFMRVNRTTKGTSYDIVARGMSSLTGGSPTQSGLIDISPETLKFWSAALTGGTGTFLSDLTHLAGLGVRATVGDAGQPGDLSPEPKEIPILRDYVKREGVQDVRRAYWDAAAEIRSSMADFTRARKGDDQAAADKSADQHGEMIALSGTMSGFNKMIKAQRDRVDEINADNHTSLAYKRGAIKQLEREESDIYDEFLSLTAYAKRADAAKRAASR